MPPPSRPPQPPRRRVAGKIAPEEPHGGKTFRIAGLPAVKALFATDPDRVERLFFDDRTKTALGDACALLAERRRPYRLVPGAELEKIAGTPLHGGVVAVATPRPVPALDPAAALDWASEGRPLLILDGVGNPHNLGAIVRTAAFFGLPRIALTDHPSQASPSDSAYRVAEGGFEHVDLFRVSGPPAVLAKLGERWLTVATTLGGHRPPGEVLSRREGRPVALILGNEERGLPEATVAACAERLTIPGAGPLQSLNVSATAAILIHLLAVGGR